MKLNSLIGGGGGQEKMNMPHYSDFGKALEQTTWIEVKEK